MKNPVRDLSLMPMNTLSSNNDLLAKMNSSDKEDIEEDESANIITNRVITSKVTNAAQELKITQDTKLLSALIRFDANFSSDTANYNWVVYHTPKEVRKNIKQIYQKISTKEINTQMLIHPIIIQMRSDQDVVININIVTDFYNKCFADPNIQNNPLLTNFFNIGGTSFLKMNAGNKPFEGWAEKRVDKHCCRKCFTIFCPCCEFCLFSRYNKRWIVLNEDHLFYLNDPSSKEGKCVYFFDKDMTIENDGKKGLNINNASMYLNLQFNSFFEREIWKQELERRKINYKLLVDNNKYNAYTNSKNYNICQYFCDGRDYFTDLFYQLMEAKQTIFITDWWMSPEVFLLRPVDEKIYLDMKEKGEITRNFGNKMTRLMDVLNYKAKQGVKIYILVYYEVSLALTLNSKHTEEILNGLNKNINVTRHPSDPFSTLLWSHHEKLVVIDQTIGYVGGLDLCWGRYDYSQHPIYEGPNPQREYHFPLIDYSNARICDFKDVQNYTIESVKREDTTRMPWHDVHSKIIGPAVCDIARHFIERWNHANFAERKEKGITSINQGAAFSQNKFNFWTLFSKALKKNSKEIETKKNENKIENPLDKLESTQTIEIKEENKIGFQEKKTLENNFMKNKDKIDDDHLLVKKGENSFYKTLVQRMGKLGSQAMKIDLEHQISNDDLYKKYFKEDSITANVQVLRSASEWSAGLRATERSILNGYYELISNAKHYIYIENQFFVSKAWTDEERKQCKHSISDIVKKADETVFKEFEGLIRNNLEDKDALLDDLKNKLKLSEALIREKDAQLAQYSKTAAEVILTREELMIARNYLNQGTGSRLNKALTLDAILEYAESLKSYERAQHIFGLLSKIARNTATDEEYEKIDAASNKLTSIQLSQTNIYNQTTAYGSNIFAGIVNSPNFPYGKTEEEVYKLIMPKIDQLLKEINQSYNGARRENKN